MTKYGETTNFVAENFMEVLEEYIGKGVLSHIIVNDKRPDEQRIKKYEQVNAHIVEYDKDSLKRRGVKVIEENVLRPMGLVRHNSDTLARIICKL
jgi:2-phospho-L-lactate transferase/gluconeogenesis factor (CofD/UPF0052 family)